MTKRRAVAVVLAVLLSVSFVSRNVYAGGIPVIDAASLTQAIQQVMHMMEQIEHMKNQLAVAEKELDRISGSRSMGGILHSSYDLAVTVDNAEVLKTVGLKSAEDHGLVGKEAEIYDEGNQNVAQWVGQSQKSFQQAQQRFSELSKLVAKVNDCPDQKDILDLQARIQAEMALLENERIKVAMIQAQAQAREAEYEAKVRQALLEAGGEPTPIAW
jgi:type IV secretion system protein VirB5